MRCSLARRTIHRSHEAPLPAALATELAGHLDSCPACRREDLLERALDQDLALLPGTLVSPPLTVDLSEPVLAAIRKLPSRHRPQGERFSLPALAGVGAVVLALGSLSLGLLPSVPAGFAETRELFSTLQALLLVPAAALAKALVGLAESLFVALAWLLSILESFVESLAPTAGTTLVSLACVATLVLTLVIGKDLLTAPLPRARKE